MDGDVTDIETNAETPSIEELQKQLKAQSDAIAQLKGREEQFIAALAEKDTRRPAPKKDDEVTEDEPLDPATAKALAKMQQQHEAQLGAVQDQHDEMSFLQYAASASLDPQTVAETTKLYADYRAQGVRVRAGDGQERPMTRADVLYQVIGRRTVADQFKGAPEKNLAALKSKLLGPAGFEGVGEAPDGRRYVKIDSEIDKLPTKDKVGKLEKALGGIEF